MPIDIPLHLNEFIKRLIKPPLFLPSMALALGISFSHWSEAGYRFVWPAMFLSLAGIGISFKKSSAMAFVLASFFLAGMLLDIPSRSLGRDHVAFLETGKGVLQGRVVSMPETVVRGKRRMTSFLFDADSWKISRQIRPATGVIQVFIFFPPEPIEYGDRLRLWGTLTEPEKATNPGELDYAAYLKLNRIYQIFQSFGARSVTHLRGDDRAWKKMIESCRRKLQKRIQQLFPYPESELVSALWIGLRRNLPREIQDTFMRSGTIHILSISGLHVSMVGGFFYFLLRQLGLRRKWNALVSMGVVVVYVLLAGADAPVLRSGIMALFIFGGILFERDHDIWNVLVVAFFLLLLCQPNTLFHLSFQLSFMSVGILVLFTPPHFGEEKQFVDRQKEYKKQSAIMRYLWGTATASFSISVVLLPYFASKFHLSSMIGGILANAVIIPASLAVLMVSLTGIILSYVWMPMAGPLVWIVSMLNQAQLLFLNRLNQVPWMSCHVPTPPGWLTLLYYLSLALIFWHSFFKNRRILGSIILVAVFMALLSRQNSPSITFLNTGPSELIFVRVPGGRNLLIQSGRRVSEGKIRWIVRPFLMASGVHRLTLLSSDSRKVLSQKARKILSDSFRLANFVPGRFPAVWCFEGEKGKLDAVRITFENQAALVVFCIDENSLERLFQSNLPPVDVLYFPVQLSKAPLALRRLIDAAKPEWIIMNRWEDWKRLLQSGIRSPAAALHFLSQDGAKTFQDKPRPRRSVPKELRNYKLTEN